MVRCSHLAWTALFLNYPHGSQGTQFYNNSACCPSWSAEGIHCGFLIMLLTPSPTPSKTNSSLGPPSNGVISKAPDQRGEIILASPFLGDFNLPLYTLQLKF